MVSIPFVTSAPGKVIIFGEHSVVYHKPAIAAALSLRAYLLVTENKDPGKVSLEFPDIQFSHSWDLKDFPWHLVQNNAKNRKPAPTEELVPEIVDELSNNLLTDIPSALHYSAAHCFLYLYLNLCSESTKGLTFTVRSTLPTGAGLGSSASISVCLSAALSYIGGHVEHIPQLLLNESAASHGKESNSDILFIDSWSFMGEKCIQGTPSGIDNACASHGGAVMFQRSNNSSIPNVRTSMRNFPSLDLLLTNTKIPRRSLLLVGKVSSLNQEYPLIMTNVLNSMEQVARELYSIMLKPFGKDSKLKLQELIKINQGLLCAIGVSHPALDKIKMLTDELQLGETKLTGAGGGGCAITLLNDDINKQDLKNLVENFESQGFETYETKLGGKGCGILIPTDDQLSLMSSAKFLEFGSRSEIETLIGCESLSNWRFW